MSNLQRELLLSDRIVAFISHTGASSALEAVTSATPVVCIPFFGDQVSFSSLKYCDKGFTPSKFDYCNRLVRAGSAVFLDKSALSVEGIREAMNSVTNASYADAANKLQKLAAASGGAIRVAELILSSHYNGIAHLVTHNAYLPWYQTQALDLRVTQFVFVFLLPFILFYCFKTIRLCFGCCCKRKKLKKD